MAAIRAVGNTSKIPLQHRDWRGVNDNRSNLLLFYDIGHKGPYHPKDFESSFSSRIPDEKWQELTEELPKQDDVPSFENAVAKERREIESVEEMKRRGWI